MDRNTSFPKVGSIIRVALRKESVDRNAFNLISPNGGQVALRKESVDRNFGNQVLRVFARPSLSARRAWIEMVATGLLTTVSPRRSPQGERG